MKTLNILPANAATKLSTPGKHADGGGLYLVNKRDGRSWLFMYRDKATGKRRELRRPAARTKRTSFTSPSVVSKADKGSAIVWQLRTYRFRRKRRPQV